MMDRTPLDDARDKLPVTFDDFTIRAMIRQFMQKPGMLREVYDKMAPSLFHNNEMFHRLTWTILCEYVKRYNKVPSIELFLAQANSMKDDEEFGVTFMQHGMWNRYVEYVQYLYNLPVEGFFTREFLMDLVREFLRERRVDAVWNYIRSAKLDPKTAKTMLEDAERMSEVNGSNYIFPMMEANALQSLKIRFEATGVPVVDKLFAGGLIPGSFVGILGPTGGGKTLLSVQMAAAGALNNQRTIYVSYEQGWHFGDLKLRFYSALTGIPISKLKLGEDKLTQDERAVFYRAQKKVGDKLVTSDMSGESNITAGTRGFDDIQDLVNQFTSSSLPPSLVIIDWLNPFLSRDASASYKQENVRHYWRGISDQFKSLAKQSKTTIVLAHQLSTEYAKKGPSCIPNHSYAMDLGNMFCVLMESVICLGNNDTKTGISWVVSSKNRGGPRETLKAKLEGDYSRFSIVGDDDFVVGRDGKFVAAGEQGVIPDAGGATGETGANAASAMRKEYEYDGGEE